MNERTCTKIVHERALSAWNEHDGMDWSPWFDVMTPLCEMCGQHAGAERHHRKNRSQGGKWLPSNILLFCSGCHRWVTEHPQSAKAFGLGSLGWIQDPAKVPVKLWYTDKAVCLDDFGGYDPCCDVEMTPREAARELTRLSEELGLYDGSGDEAG